MLVCVCVPSRLCVGFSARKKQEGKKELASSSSLSLNLSRPTKTRRDNATIHAGPNSFIRKSRGNPGRTLLAFPLSSTNPANANADATAKCGGIQRPHMHTWETNGPDTVPRQNPKSPDFHTKKTAASHRTVVFVNGLGFSGSRLGPPSRLPGLSPVEGHKSRCYGVFPPSRCGDDRLSPDPRNPKNPLRISPFPDQMSWMMGSTSRSRKEGGKHA